MWMIGIGRIDPTEWHPDDRRTGRRETATLEAGMLVEWERKPHRVISCTQDEPLDWPASTREKWLEADMPEPAEWHQRPYTLALRPELTPGGKDVWLSAQAFYRWWTPPEHFALCHLCHELSPCSHVWGEEVTKQAGREMEAVMKLIPGCCLHCTEPVTRRQKSVRFEGENLVRPDFGEGTAIFHSRKACWSAASDYDRRWAQAHPGRQRKLRCTGLLRHHFGGSEECSEGVECPQVPGGAFVAYDHTEWHNPEYGSRKTMGCWCVSGDLMAGPIANSVTEERA